MNTSTNETRRARPATRHQPGLWLARAVSLVAALLLWHPAAWAQCEKLFWQDEFNGPAIDRSKWDLEVRGDDQGTNQLDYATDRPENARIENGQLQLNILKEEYLGKHYTSARLRTYKKLDFQYGRVVARVKGVYSQGNGFAFWMLGSDFETVTWPKCGEIDIFENTGRTPSRNIGTAHFAGPDGHQDVFSQGDTILPAGRRWADEFHDVGIEWSPTYIKWTIDGKVYHTLDLTNPLNGYRPFNRPFFIILSVGMGGNYSGPPDATTVSPMTATVDWVHVYKGTYSTFVSGDEKMYQGEQNKQYTVNTTDDGTYKYNWTVPAGATIVSGQGTPTATIDWGQTGGKVGVQVTSSCSANSYALNVTAEAPFVVDQVLENFESPPAFTYGSVAGSLTKGAPNPLKNLVNPSDKVGKYIRNAGQPYDAIVMQNVKAYAGDFVFGKRRILLDVYTDAPPGTKVNLNFENKAAAAGNYPNGRYALFAAVTTKQNQWETLELEYTGSPSVYTGATDVDQWVLFFAQNTSTGNVYYYDNLRTGQAGGTPRTLDTRVLENFDGTDLLTKDFSNGAYSVQANPAKVSPNASATVAKYVRNAAESYDALVYLTNAIPDGHSLRTGVAKVTVDVYSDAPVGTKLSLNFETSAPHDPNKFPEGIYAIYQAVTTKQNQWETVTFSLSAAPNGGVSDAAVGKMVFLLNPVTNTSNTYYLDNIQITSTAPKETLVLANVLEDYDANDLLTVNASTTGAYSPKIANPKPGGTNTSANVAKYVRNATAQYDFLILNKNAATLDAGALKNRTQKFALDVYTDAPAGTPILMGLDASSLLGTSENSGKHSNYQGVTTVQGAWHTVYFTFGAQPDNSVPDNLVDHVAILFELGKFTGTTYYIDNLRTVNVVQQPTLTTIAVTPALAQNVAVGQKVQFAAQGKNQFGANIAAPVTWAVSGGGTIDANGLFTASANGAFKVSATSTGVTGKADVLVGQAIKLATLSVDPVATFVYQGSTLALTARGVDQTGAPFAFTPTWAVSGAVGVTVSSSGLLTASSSASGTAAVKVSSGTTSATATITVRTPPVADSLVVGPVAAKVYQGDALQFTATTYDQYRNPIAAPLTWSVSGGGSIAASGLFTSATVGTFVVKLQAGRATASTYVSVVPKPANLALNKPARASSVQGNLLAFYATDGVTTSTTPDTRWGSIGDSIHNSVPQFIRVDLGQKYDLSRVVLYWEAAYGKVYDIQVADDTVQTRRLAYHEPAGNGDVDDIALLAGSSGRYVWMTATVRGSSFGYSLYEMQVYGLLHQDAALKSIIVTPNFSTVAAGKSVTFKAAGFDQFGNPAAIAPAWTATGGSISGAGVFSGAAGSYTVTATSGGVSGAASITVAPSAVAGQLIPGRIEAESYSAMSGVATEPTADTDGVRNVSYISTGDWMDYAVNVQTAGTYTVQLRVAGFAAGAALQLKAGSTVLCTVPVPNTGGSQRWATVTATAALPAGAQTLRVAITGGGFNLNWLDFALPGARAALATAPAAKEKAEPLGVFPNPATRALTLTGLGTAPATVAVYDAKGALVQRVRFDQPSNPAVLDVSGLKTGLYFIRATSLGVARSQRFIKE